MCVHDCVNFVRTGFSVFQPGLMFKKKKRGFIGFLSAGGDCCGEVEVCYT